MDCPVDSNLWWLDMSALQGILPGTLWCGMGDQASSYHQLGPRRKLDGCCRAHDHCPVKLRPMMSRYGVTNYGFQTKSVPSGFCCCWGGRILASKLYCTLFSDLFTYYFVLLTTRECMSHPSTPICTLWSSFADPIVRATSSSSDVWRLRETGCPLWSDRCTSTTSRWNVWNLRRKSRKLPPLS